MPVTTPLAICLNKLDRWGRLLDPGTRLHEWACGVPDRDRPDPTLDQTIHDEVQTALRRWGAAGFLEYIALNFPNHRFFACSALGDAAQDREDLPQPLAHPLARRTPRPLAAPAARRSVVTGSGEAGPRKNAPDRPMDSLLILLDKSIETV